MKRPADGDASVTDRVEASLDTLLEKASVPPQRILEEARIRGLHVAGADTVTQLRSLRGNTLEALDDMARSFVRAHARLAAAQGFVTGLGGVITLPVAVPTDVLAFLYLVARTNSAVMQTYGFETATEEGQLALRLGLAAGLGVNKLTVMGTSVLVESLTRQVMTRPYRDAVVLATLRATAKRAGITLTKRHFAKVVPVLGGGINAGVSGAVVYGVGMKTMSHYRALVLPPSPSP